ncbi:MAG: extracellular solute-binding protein [Chloroflexi bacterium]|nr:MAG: extracellular solute-binding protein [Chloroflexota bacterium]
MHRRIPALSAVIVVLAILITACSGGNAASSGSAASGTPVPSGPPVEIKWYCCLGTGDDKTQLPIEAKVVDDFNKSHPHIKLVFDHVAYNGARDAFATRLASGTPPDVVGPLGVGGAEAFRGQWLDLAPLIAKNHYDLTQYGKGAVDFYKVAGQGQIGIPFAVYPSELYYQPDMFDEAGLNYPPQKYGDKYKMPDGSMVDWNYDAVRQIAMKLTVDANNKDATQAGFDPKKIQQYGFEPQRDDLRGMGAYFGAGKLAADDNKTVQIPEGWAQGWKWIYDGMFKDHFIMTNSVYKSTAFNGGGYAFNSGKVAMQENFLWNVCCVTDAGGNWNLAAIPSNNGKTTAVFNADTFRITKESKHPDEAFTVLTYLLGDASKTLLNAYSAFPARTADQADFFTGLEAQKDSKGKPVYPPNVDWKVAVDGIQYADNPNFEAWMPAYNKSLDLLQTKLTRWTSTPGLNMDQEITTLKTQLQAIWDKG